MPINGVAEVDKSSQLRRDMSLRHCNHDVGLRLYPARVVYPRPHIPLQVRPTKSDHAIGDDRVLAHTLGLWTLPLLIDHVDAVDPLQICVEQARAELQCATE
eukprot:CAMPEP_0180579344 /NCGR_PEP_ID=MMETSP1037_2-20121125/12941_1 /TAXON_ID=632150 /ORGANISM="Azadinium spinosum, Strain 3D9" /LENGTH=101 /DNA_ID=CAMNT_0022597199 /DNA_START=344 /DNA_END=646 /DNA_ORIENTATION=-